MSNSTDTTGCISHKPNCRFFVIYEDFRDIARKASGTEHEYKLAAFWRVLETKTNDRITAIPEIAEECKQKGIPIPEEHLWIEMSYADFAKRAQGVYKSSSFQVAAAESERVGFSKSRNRKRPRNPSDPESALEDYKEYLFFADVMQTAITKGELPPPIDFNSPLLKSIPERKKKRQEKRAIEKNRESLLKSIAPPIEINTSPLLKSIGNNNIDKDITNDITNNERESSPNTLDTHTIVSSDTAHTDTLQDEKMFTNDEPQGDDHATAASGHPHRVGDVAAPGVDGAGSPSQDRPLATPEIRPVLEARQKIDNGKDTSPLTPAQSLPLPQDAQAASGTRTRTRKPAQPKLETRSNPPVEPPADMAWGTRKCLLWFDFWRGGILIGKWKLMQASTCAKGLAEQFDEQTVIQARTDMETDPYYAAKGGCDVCDVANNIHKYLKRRERQHLQLVAAIPTSNPLPRIATKEELRRIPV